eukprot:TRINITY_DN66_c0_g1_i3.p1 TRINITY_DN66_c0_g1~~TRINITY_DN66_c0_g1_i3.p1  ORF type:complete len:127 (+),score=47.89 TRINITY_DN66_c0_g1_i3:124-504(+)
MSEAEIQQSIKNLPNEQVSAEEKAKKKSEAEEQRQMIMFQITTADARERLNRIRMVNPDKVTGIENLLLQMAQQGKLGAKVDESELMRLLEQISKQESENRPKVTIQRRKNAFSDTDSDSDPDWCN